MIPKRRLGLAHHGRRRRARGQRKRYRLKRRVQAAAHLPAERAALPRLVLGERPGDVVELGALGLDLGQGLFLSGVFFALRAESAPSSSSSSLSRLL